MYGLKSLGENWKRNSRSLHYATPDFLSNLVALANFMRLFLRKAAHAAMSSAAWQEIRVRSGRDDNSIARKWPQKRSDEWLLMGQPKCPPGRSVAQWRDLLFLFRFSRSLFSPWAFSLSSGGKTACTAENYLWTWVTCGMRRSRG